MDKPQKKADKIIKNAGGRKIRVGKDKGKWKMDKAVKNQKKGK
jgi:hypothetical protein